VVDKAESFEGVRASTLTWWPPFRQFFRTAKPVPPVAPKMATVGSFDVDVDMVLLMRER